MLPHWTGEVTMAIIQTKKADYIATELRTGEVAVSTSPHDGGMATRFVFRDLGSAKHWLRLQRNRDAGVRFATQGMLK